MDGWLHIKLFIVLLLLQEEGFQIGKLFPDKSLLSSVVHRFLGLWQHVLDVGNLLGMAQVVFVLVGIKKSLGVHQGCSRLVDEIVSQHPVVQFV